jgi:phage portal protein BeeE
MVKNPNSARPIMAERRRNFWDRLTGRRATPEDTAELNKMLTGTTGSGKGPIDWDGKTLASLSKIGVASGQTSGKQGMTTDVDYSLLRSISNKSEVVNAIIRRCVDDTLSNGYEFVLADGKEQGDQSQLNKLREFFTSPNPDDMGDEWLESLLFDLILFGNAYLELDGSNDSSNKSGENWVFNGDLVSMWPVSAESMKLIPARQTPKPPKMAYIQEINKETRKFASNKIIHICKFKQGNGYGASPLIPLLETIAGQLNLSNYMNALYTGTLPKTILNVGDISNSEMKAMLGLIEQQLSGGKSPFGLIAINGGSGFNMHRLIDSTREGAQMDMLYYYREEICAVFGIPPMKLGWVQTGKMANPEQQLDAWYDVVDSYHSRLSSMINNNILPLLGITDYVWKFVSIRPSREAERADTLKSRADAVSVLRQEGAISINEAREILGFDSILDDKANDPFFTSPKLQINQPNSPDPVGPEAEDEPELSLLDIFPEPEYGEGEGEKAGEFPGWGEDFSDPIDADTKILLSSKRLDDHEEFDRIINSGEKELNSVFERNQKEFADRLLGDYNRRFNNKSVINLTIKSGTTYQLVEKAPGDVPPPTVFGPTIGRDEITWAVDLLDRELKELLDKQTIGTATTLTAGFDATLAQLAKDTGVGIAFGTRDAEAMSYWAARWQLPALRRTLGAHRGAIIKVFDQMNRDGESWDWAARRMRDAIDPSGKAYPAYYYRRIARTEPARIVENAHLSGLKKTGFQFVQRLVTVDDVTDKETCVPFENAVYPIDKSGGVIPAHPNCRCTFVPYEPSDETSPVAPLPDSDILKPDVEGAEILGVGGGTGFND